MDNRRVIRSYREKQAALKKATPYSRPTSGLLSKVRQYLAPVSLWKTSGTHRTNDQVNQSNPLAHSQGDPTALVPFKFSEPEYKTPHTLQILTSKDVAAAPNDVLSSFFQSKGDRPLTEVEYEGVVALLSRSRQATPLTLRVQDLTSKRLSISQSAMGTPARQLELINKDKPNDIANSSNIIITPHSQRVLKADTTAFSTPEYRPVYHTVNDNSFSRNSRGIPSVKRVYHFSGLPSPYRTKIKTPNLSVKKQNVDVLDQDQLSLQLKKQILDSHNTSTTSTSTTTKPLSNTASTILSILDGSNTKNIDEDTIKSFSSPYARPKKSNETQKQKTKLSAEDISKTMLFDKSENLPEINFNKKRIPIDFEVSASNDKKKLKTASGSVPVKEEKSTLPLVGLSKPNPASGKPIVPDQKSFEQSKETAPEPFSTKNTQSSSASTKPSFSFGAIQKPSLATNPVDMLTKDNQFTLRTLGSDTSANSLKACYTFPEIQQKAVQFDQDKVNSYKPLYKF